MGRCLRWRCWLSWRGWLVSEDAAVAVMGLLWSVSEYGLVTWVERVGVRGGGET